MKTEKVPPIKPSMTWAMRLKRVFNIDIAQCEHCEGRLKVIVKAVSLQQLLLATKATG